MISFFLTDSQQLAVERLLPQGLIIVLLYMWSDTYSSLEGVHMQLATMIYMFSICKP